MAALPADAPLVFMLDGQNAFSPGGPFGSWDADLLSHQLVEAGKIPPFLLAAMDNTAARLREYTPTAVEYEDWKPLGNQLLMAIRDEILPALEQQAGRAFPANQRVLAGSSLGGLMAFEAAHHFRDTWGTCIAMSPAFWVDPKYFQGLARRPPEQRARLYLDSGDSGRSRDDMENTRQIYALMKEAGAEDGARLRYRLGQGDEHNEAAWRRRLPEALTWALAPPER